MGRIDSVTADQVASILSVHVSYVHRLTRLGHLRAQLEETKDGKKQKVYRLVEVEAYKKIRDENVDLPTVYIRATQALAISTELEDRLRRVESLLGLDVDSFPKDQAEVVALVKLTEGAAQNPPEEAADIMQWAKVLLSIYPESLELITRFTDYRSPWIPFQLLAHAIEVKRSIGRDAHDRELSLAHGYLGTARRQLENTIFNYIYEKEGLRAAQRVLPHTETDPYERILRYLPH